MDEAAIHGTKVVLGNLDEISYQPTEHANYTTAQATNQGQHGTRKIFLSRRRASSHANGTLSIATHQTNHQLQNSLPNITVVKSPSAVSSQEKREQESLKSLLGIGRIRLDVLPCNFILRALFCFWRCLELNVSIFDSKTVRNRTGAKSE